MQDYEIIQSLSASIYDSELDHIIDQPSSPRSAQRFEIEFPLEDGGIMFFDEEEHPILKNHIFISKPGQVRHFKPPYRCFFIHLTLQECLLNDFLSELPQEIDISNANACKKIFSDIIVNVSSKNKESSLYLISKIYSLVYTLYTEVFPKQSFNIPSSEPVARAIAYMNMHYTENPSLEEIANFVNLSPVYFHRLFTNTMRTTPFLYMLDKRLCRAEVFLKTTTLSVSDISELCGFSSQSHLGTAFKKKHGITPLKYRKEMT